MQMKGFDKMFSKLFKRKRNNKDKPQSAASNNSYHQQQSTNTLHVSTEDYLYSSQSNDYCGDSSGFDSGSSSSSD